MNLLQQNIISTNSHSCVLCPHECLICLELIMYAEFMTGGLSKLLQFIC